MPNPRLEKSAEPVAPPVDGESNFRSYRVGKPAEDDFGRAFAPGQEEMDLASPRVRQSVGPLPRRRGKLSPIGRAWFALAFVLPIALSAIYLLFFAAKQYVCEFRFSVREPVSQQTIQAGAAAATASLFGGSATPGTDLLDNFTVVDYVQSEQAAFDLQKRVNLRQVFSKPKADFVARFNPNLPNEKLAAYWKRTVYSNYDPATGIAIVRVRAFTPGDAYAIATNLLDLSSDLVNSIGTKSQQDSLKYAQQEVDRTQRQVVELRTQLASLRLQHGVIDPTNSTVAGNATLANTLRGNLAQLQTQITSLTAQLHNPQAPQIEVLRQQLQATRSQLAQVEKQVVASGGDTSSLTRTVGQFEAANTRLQDAAQLLLNNLSNLQQAQASADSQRLYITTYVQPHVPQSSIYPNKLTSLFLVVLVSGMFWMIGLLLGQAVAHRIR